VRTLMAAAESLRNGNPRTIQDFLTVVPPTPPMSTPCCRPMREAGIRVVFAIAQRTSPPLDSRCSFRKNLPEEMRHAPSPAGPQRPGRADFVSGQIRRLAKGPDQTPDLGASPAAPQRCSGRVARKASRRCSRTSTTCRC